MNAFITRCHIVKLADMLEDERNKMSAIVQLFQYLIYFCLRSIFRIFQEAVWILTGVFWIRARKRDPENYSSSAHVQRVLVRHKFDCIAQPAGSGNFVTVHEAFVNPSYVLQDNVTLYSVTPTEAVFVETAPDVDVTSSDCHCFMRVAQYYYAVRVIVMPLASMHRLAEEMGEPRGKLIFVTSTARCGSTLLCQILEATEHCMSYSEPDYFHVINAHSNKIPADAMERIIRNCTRILCKPVSTKPDVQAYLIKPIAHYVTAVPLLQRVFPDAHQLFMYRDGLQVTRSMMKMFDEVPISQIMVFVATYLPWLFHAFAHHSVHFPTEDLPEDMCDRVEFGVFVWALTCRSYNQLKKANYPIHAFKYEYLVQQPVNSIKSLLRHCGLPEELAQAGMKAMKKDSQRGSVISVQNMSKKKDIVIVGKNRQVADRICDHMQLPRIDKPCMLQDTINAEQILTRRTTIA